MKRSLDSNLLLRSFFIHCYSHIITILRANDPSKLFTAPRFPLFMKLKHKYKSGSKWLFKNIIYTFKNDLIFGVCITLIFVLFNLLVPELIKMFMHYLHGHHSESKEVRKGENFIKLLVGVQILRVVFGEHTRRIFHEISLKIESSLARMLIVKSLSLTQKARKDIPHSELLQLENVDLRLISIMFSNMYFIIEAPLTILAALVMLFLENPMYGFIGGYWFLIAFLLHRQIDQKMTHCNATKLNLIERRSKINYEIMDTIKEAKIIKWEDIMIEKNNDLFLIQNHDHEQFYFFNTLYDIILIMLPILVVVTIGLWDVGKSNQFTVEQVYLMLSLLGICYEPMKQFRTISISFHDGLHSLNRLQQFFDLPEQTDNKKITQDTRVGNLIIEKNTIALYSGFGFFLKVNFQMEVNTGERLIIVGQKGHGRTSFINFINGFLQIREGSIRMNGRVAYISEKFFFIKSTVRNNIAFHNQNISPKEINNIAQKLGLINDLRRLGGLDAQMEQTLMFTKSQLQRISIARVLCSLAHIYILDCPFEHLDVEHKQIVEQLLRQKQQQKKVTIIVAAQFIEYNHPDDQIAIVNQGEIIEYGYYRDILKDKNSTIKNYFQSKDDKQSKLSSCQDMSEEEIRDKFKQPQKRFSPKRLRTLQLDNSIRDLLQNSIDQLKESTKIDKKKQKFRNHLKQFILCVPIIQILFILLIIACAEFLHIFIHFWIGHLQEEHGENSYMAFKFMILVEVILTLGLVGVLYYEGQVSSKIAIIQGNSIYKKSLTGLLKNKIYWFAKEYSIKIADRFNHDYEQVFIACHNLLGIYKNIIILIVTVFFISSDGFTGLSIFLIITSLYLSIFFLFRAIERKIVKHYYEIKYGFVRCFEESIEGTDYYRVFGSKNKLLKRAQQKYQRLVAYKLAQKYTNHGLSIACDIMSILLLATVVYYSMEMNIHNNRSNLAVIATTIHLLMNGSQILKNIVKDTISFQTFFHLNLIPVLQMMKHQSEEQQWKNNENWFQGYEYNIGYTLFLKQVQLQGSQERSTTPLTLKIEQGEHVLIYQRNDDIRNLFIQAFTQNIDKKTFRRGQILIGNKNILKIQPLHLSKQIGVIMSKNFYISGTLRQNLIRKIHVEDQKVKQLIKQLKLDQDIQDYDAHGLDSQIHFEESKINYELTKKFALIRIILNQGKIIILKDITTFIYSICIIDVIKKYLPEATIIKLSNRIQSAFNVDRIIAIENGVIVEDGSPQTLKNDPNSEIGMELNDSNVEGFLFMNKVSKVHYQGRRKRRKSMMMKKSFDKTSRFHHKKS